MDVNELDEEVLEDFYDVIARWIFDPDKQAIAVTELTKYKLKEGKYSNNFVQKWATKQPAWKWWLLHGVSTPILHCLALQVLAQCMPPTQDLRGIGAHISMCILLLETCF